MVCRCSYGIDVWRSILENEKNDMGMVVTEHSYPYVHCDSVVPEVKYLYVETL